MRAMGLVVAALAAASCASASRRPAGDDAARFEKVKSLAGTWTVKDAGPMPAGAKVVYRVTAGGSAVEETEFHGTPHEMVTVYTLDEGHLQLTHFCVLGNQPRMELMPSSNDNALVFDLTSLGNGDPAKDVHMHHAEFTLTDSNHLVAAWTLWEDGKPGDTHRLSLERSAN